MSSATSAGAASRSAPSSAGNSRAAVPSPASSSSSGWPASPRASQPNPVPVHTSAAGSIRLGSSADCSENSTRQAPVVRRRPPPAASALSSRRRRRPRQRGVRLDQPEAGPDRAAGQRRAGQPLGERGGQLPCLALVGRARHLDQGIGAVRATSIRSRCRDLGRAAAAPRGQQGTRQPGARRRVRQRVEHVRQQRAGLRGAGVGRAARQAAGIAAASSRACCASAADSTGRQRAAYPPSSGVSTGSTRPRATRSAANRATAAR